MFDRKTYLPLAATAVLALGLYGCGGGGGSSPRTDGETMMPADDMVTEFGNGLFASPETSPEAASSADTLASLSGTNTALAPVSAAIGLDYNDQDHVSIVPLEDERSAYIESATVQDAEGNITVVCVVDNRRTEVQFQAGDWTGSEYAKRVGGTDYYIWFAPTFTGAAPREYVTRRYLGLLGWQAGKEARGYAADGLLTPPDRLTSLGSATYEGQFVGDFWRANDPTPGFIDNLGTVWAEITLAADFSGGTVGGTVENMRAEGHGLAYSDTWVTLPDTNSIEVLNGTISGNRFHGEFEGRDTNASSDLRYSIRGFEGSVLGEFYGPNGEEVGGVITGQRESTNQIINGRFGAEKQ